MDTIDTILSVRSVPPKVIVVTALASYGGIILAAAAGWPLWATIAAATGPWAFIFLAETRWTWRNYGWLSLFYVLVVSQAGHFSEHFIQMIQIHVLDRSGAQARGIFGQLDIEWVHFVWNTWILVAIVLLLTRFRENKWLWVSLVAAVWHEIEHAFIMTKYLGSYGRAGHPGLLSEGGAIGGGLSISRPDLHFLYNVVETVPIVIAFAWQLRHTRNEWVARALPDADDAALVTASERARPLKVPAGQIIVAQGSLPDAFYVIVNGEVEVSAVDGEGERRVLRSMGAGETFGEIGLLTDQPRSATVTATSEAELLRIDAATFREVMQRSQVTQSRLEHVAAARFAT